MQKITIRNKITGEVFSKTEWMPDCEFEEVWRVLQKPSFFGNSEVWEKEVEHTNMYEVSSHGLTIGVETSFGKAIMAAALAVVEDFADEIVIVDQDTGEILYEATCY